ncbi:MAG: hypothetical protein FWF54_02680 [Candidatus Azobacteroides sp.]|nr:hypothetical protein [Candidatus Azobacteroides sp.]
MAKEVIKVEKRLPEILPQGWKKAVALRIGIHPAFMCQILAAGKGPTYMKVIETAKSLYGKSEKNNMIIGCCT